MYSHTNEHFTSRAPIASQGTSVGASSRGSNLGGQSARDREVARAAVYDRDGSKARRDEERRLQAATNDFDLLKRHHRFIRDDEESPQSYGDAVARKYEDSLFKEYAVCDLKHFKSGRLALRWRTPTEVIDGLGQNTCGSLRCPFHDPPADSPPMPRLETFEVPFAYEEQGQPKQALVKLVCCSSCKKKLLYRKKEEGSRVERRSRSPELRGGEGSARRRDR